MSSSVYSKTLLLICSSTDGSELMHPSFRQLLNLTGFLTFNLIFIYSSLSNIWNSKELAPVFLPKIIQTEWYAWDIAHTVNLTHPIIGSYITWLVRLIHPGHISTPTYVPSKHPAQPIDRMLDTLDFTPLQLREVCAENLKCPRVTRALRGLNPSRFLQPLTTGCRMLRNHASVIQKSNRQRV